MAETEDLYEILQLHPSAYSEVIQATFHLLAQLFHTNRNPTRAAAIRMAEINRAYVVLSDPEQRAAYDRSRSQGRSEQRNTTSVSSPVPDVIRAKSFQLVNDDDEVRAELGLDDDGSLSLTMRDQEGNDRCVLRRRRLTKSSYARPKRH